MSCAGTGRHALICELRALHPCIPVRCSGYQGRFAAAAGFQPYQLNRGRLLRAAQSRDARADGRVPVFLAWALPRRHGRRPRAGQGVQQPVAGREVGGAGPYPLAGDEVQDGGAGKGALTGFGLAS